MEHVGAAQLVFLFHLGNRQQDVGQPRTGNGAVHAHVVRADAAAGRKSVFASAPKAQAFGLAVAHRNAGGTGCAQHLAHAPDFFFHLFGCAIAFAQQNGFRAQVVARVYKVFHRGGHGLVHHLQPGGDDAGGDHRSHRIARFAQVVKAGHDAAGQLGLGHQLDSDLGGHCQHALAADHHAHQVVAGRIKRVATKLDGLAFHGEAAHLEHVVERQTVFQAVHAARVLGHVAANRAGNLAAGVRRVIQPIGRGRFTDSQVAHAALHHRRAAALVYLQDFVELGQRERNPHGVGHGTTRQAGARAARHHRHIQAMTHPQHCSHLLFSFRQGHQQRALAVGGQAVAFVGRGVFRLVEQRMLRQIGL